MEPEPQAEAEAPSGAQFELRYGGQRLVAVEVGATLREYEVDGQPVLDGFAADQMADGGRGQPLLPWPNRLADGRYEFGGQQLQLPIDEIERNNAIHGLTRWLNWQPVEQAVDRVRLELVLHPRPGYPFTLALAIEYRLEERGLVVQTLAQNRGVQTLPFGAAQHPYFTVGTSAVDDVVLQVPSARRLELDAERRLPTGRVVTSPETDFVTPRRIGQAHLDECYCELDRITASMTNPDTGRTLRFWADEHYKYLQVFTGDTLAPARRRMGLAIEPMTCPPNAFATRTDVIVLNPGESIALEWGVGAT
jgi:aldose 1-epimerase